MMSEPMTTDSEYTIEDFLGGKMYVQCDNEEERDMLRVLSGWDGQDDALCDMMADFPILYRHDRYDMDKRYNYTFFSRVGAPFFKHLPVVMFGELRESAPDGIQFDSGIFMEMLGCGGKKR